MHLDLLPLPLRNVNPCESVHQESRGRRRRWRGHPTQSCPNNYRRDPGPASCSSDKRLPPEDIVRLKAGNELIVVVPAITSKTDKGLAIIHHHYVNVFQRDSIALCLLNLVDISQRSCCRAKLRSEIPTILCDGVSLVNTN